MKIGIDLDGVVFDTEALWSTYAELYDILDLKRNSVINRKDALVQTKYDWTEEEIAEYFDKYGYDITITLVPGAKEVIELLKKINCELIIITARGKNARDGKEIVFKILDDFKIKFDKYYFGASTKVDECKKEQVDIMIDDNYDVCRELSKNGIKCLYFHSLGRKHITNDKNIVEIYNWGEIYRYICNIKKLC